jgi:hypothetical protein
LGDADELLGSMSGPDWDDDHFSALRALDEVTDRPEAYRLLDRLVGVWDIEGSWRIRTDRPPVAVGGRLEISWILRGRFLESTGYPAEGGDPTSKVIYGFDPRREDYFAFAVNALTRHYDLEHGDHDPAADALLLRGVEVMLPGRREIAFLRTITFIGPEEFHVSITYPEEDDQEDLGEMTMQCRRRPGTDGGGS